MNKAEEWITRICDNSRETNIFSALVYLEIVQGSVRDMLLTVEEYREKQNEEDAEINIVDRYVQKLRKKIKEEKDEGIKYHLLQEYALRRYMNAIWGERRQWKAILTYLRNNMELKRESISPETDRIRRKRHEEDITIIYDWLINTKMYLPTADKDIILEAIYKECICTRDVIKSIHRGSSRSFVTYLGDLKSKDSDNLTDFEMMHYEKIIRGIYRECGKLGEYSQIMDDKIKIYEAELEVYQKMEGNYLVNWTKILHDSFEEVMTDFE